MSAPLHFQSIFGFSNDVTTWLLVAVLLATTSFIILLAVHYITYQCLESRRKEATMTLEVLPPIVRERTTTQGLQGHHGITVEDLKASIKL